MICPNCGHNNKKAGTRCPSCKAWLIVREEEMAIALEDIKDDDFKRIVSGPWDPCFGGGMVCGSTLLVGGAPGVGKSTLFLHIAGALAQQNLATLYLSAEEKLAQIKERARRINIMSNRMIRLVDMRTNAVDVVEILKANKFGLLIIDSLKAIAPDDSSQLAVCKIAKDFAIQQDAPVMISHQVNKKTDFYGLMAIQHEVDTTLYFDDLGDNIRELETRKNRNGEAYVTVRFAMGEHGLTELAETEDQADPFGLAARLANKSTPDDMLALAEGTGEDTPDE